MKTILLNPGPVSLSEHVRDALSRPDLCHREEEFVSLQQGLREKLLRVYDLHTERWAAILLTGSGTAAIEAMVSSCIPRGGHLLSIENGVYGERMSKIARTYGIETESLRAEWGGMIDLPALERRLATDTISHVTVVHHETTTGRLNELTELLDICAAANVRVLLDGVSSFGAEAIDFSHPALEACAATANKCLHGVPGTSFVIAERETMLSQSEQPRSVYLDLRAYFSQQETGGTPFTQSVQTFYALDAALDEFFAAGGLPARHQLFSERMAAVRQTLAGLGIDGLLPAGDSSCVLNAFALPANTSYQSLHDALKAEGFVIYAGQGKLAETLFRISMMGEITAADVKRLCETLASVIGAP